MEAAPCSVGGKTARACDGCVRRRARWYCAADDAFLCQSCDASVHSANPLARRHQRIHLNTASNVSSDELGPSWLKGFKRKARTPRVSNNSKLLLKVQSVVPDLIETSSQEECQQKEQSLYRVPVFDPVLTEFCSPMTESYDAKPSAELSVSSSQTLTESPDGFDDVDKLSGYLPSEMELAEFTANMESLLGDGVDCHDDAFCIEKMGLVEPMEDTSGDGCLDFATPLSETEKMGYEGEDGQVELDIEVSKELGFEWEDMDEAKVGVIANDEEKEVKKTAKLSLDYEAVIAASSSKGLSPWTDGKRPHISLDNGWPDYMGMWMNGGVAGVQLGQGEKQGDGEREARVSRYREKRRMRLFSKKIRYEVRKLNAEKRPRMKGRFVKRTPGLIAFAH